MKKMIGDNVEEELVNIESYVKEVLSIYGLNRSKLIPILQAIQSRFLYLPRKALEYMALRLGVPLPEILTVATFYHQFRLQPVGKYVFQVCFGTACYLRGAHEVYETLKFLAKNFPVTVEKVRCFGCCSLAPVIMVVDIKGNERSIYGKLTPSEARKIFYNYVKKIRR